MLSDSVKSIYWEIVAFHLGKRPHFSDNIYIYFKKHRELLFFDEIQSFKKASADIFHSVFSLSLSCLPLFRILHCHCGISKHSPAVSGCAIWLRPRSPSAEREYKCLTWGLNVVKMMCWQLKLFTCHMSFPPSPLVKFAIRKQRMIGEELWLQGYKLSHTHFTKSALWIQLSFFSSKVCEWCHSVANVRKKILCYWEEEKWCFWNLWARSVLVQMSVNLLTWGLKFEPFVPLWHFLSPFVPFSFFLLSDSASASSTPHSQPFSKPLKNRIYCFPYLFCLAKALSGRVTDILFMFLFTF